MTNVIIENLVQIAATLLITLIAFWARGCLPSSPSVRS